MAGQAQATKELFTNKRLNGAMKKFVSPAAEVQRPGFWGRELNPKDLAAQRQFLEEMEKAVAIANREVIHRQIPNLTRDTFQQLAVMVARYRAAYLEAAIKLCNAHDPADADRLADLRQRRELFDEGRFAFEALERAIERGYVDFGPRH
jgi:hypothetical protein